MIDLCLSLVLGEDSVIEDLVARDCRINMDGAEYEGRKDVLLRSCSFCPSSSSEESPGLSASAMPDDSRRIAFSRIKSLAECVRARNGLPQEL